MVFWGAVLEHAELQSEALARARPRREDLIGNDPPGTFTRALHPRHGRHDDPPPDVIPVGRTVIVPANGSLPNLVLTPQVTFRLEAGPARGAVRRPAHARADDAGDLRLDARRREVPDRRDLARGRRAQLDAFGLQFWGFLMDRIDHRIAVSEQAAASAKRWLPRRLRGHPERRPDPAARRPGRPREPIVFIGRHDKRKGLPVLLRAWPDIHRRTGRAPAARRRRPARGAAALARDRIPHDGIDVLGFLTQEELTAELLRTKALAAPSIGQESFGMVLTRAFACAVPVVASDIPGTGR